MEIPTLCESSAKVRSDVPRSGVIVGIPDNGGATVRIFVGKQKFLVLMPLGHLRDPPVQGKGEKNYMDELA